jgi:hypothetical protein
MMQALSPIPALPSQAAPRHPALRCALPARQQRAFERLWSCDLSFVVERVVRERRMPRGVAEAALVEYRKFMAMSLVGDSHPMYSAEVDEIWHAHLLFTRHYAAFCEQLLGEFVHHEPEPPPDASAASASEEELAALAAERAGFFATYRELFGEPSPLWGRESFG